MILLNNPASRSLAVANRLNAEGKGEKMKKSVGKWKQGIHILLTVAIVAGLAGCQAKSTDTVAKDTKEETQTQTSTKEETDTKSEEKADAKTEVKTVKVGIGNAYNPMCYLDENGDLQGYDYETLKKIDELLPQYEFTYEPTEFKNILVGLDTKNYDIAVHHYGWNKERGEKYLYGTVGDFYGTGYDLVVAKGSDIVVNSEDDLAGLKIAVQTSSNVAYLTENYNQAHPDKQIEIAYDDGTKEQLLASVNSGVYDGILGTPFGDAMDKKAYGDVFDVKGEKLFFDSSQANGCYFIYNYGDEQLQKDIDEKQQELLDSGWQKELSEKLLGADYTIDLSK